MNQWFSGLRVSGIEAYSTSVDVLSRGRSRVLQWVQTGFSFDARFERLCQGFYELLVQEL